MVNNDSLTLDLLKPFLKSLVQEVVSELNLQPEQKFYSRQDLMKAFNLSYPTVIDHEKRGLLTGGMQVGRKHVYSQSDVDRYLTRIPKAPCCKVA